MALPAALTKAAINQRQSISGGVDSYLGPLLRDMARVLTSRMDDLTTKFGDRIYDQMLTDSGVASFVDGLVMMCLGPGIQIAPTITDDKDPQFALSNEIALFCKRNLVDWLDRPYKEVFAEYIRDAIIYGACSGELEFEVGSDPVLKKQDAVLLKSISPKSRRKYKFLVDRSMRVLGVVPTDEGYSSLSNLVDPTLLKPGQVIPRSMLMIWTIGSRYGDPRGTSSLRRAYIPYYIKTQLWPAYLKFLVQFGTPSLLGVLPDKSPETVPKRDSTGAPIINPLTGMEDVTTPMALMMDDLLTFQGGSAMVVEFGGDVRTIKADGGEVVFDNGIELLNREMAMAILLSARSVVEAKNSSKADAESAQDLTMMLVQNLRDSLCEVIQRDVLWQLVAFNYGVDVADVLTPTISLNTVVEQDFDKEAAGWAQLWASGLLHISLVPAIWKRLGLEGGDFEAMMTEHADAAEQEKALALERAKIGNPGIGSGGE